MDGYGPFVPTGGGAFSGKDPTKLDRSGAYMARCVAKNIVASGIARRCQVTLTYAIGMAKPLAVEVDTFGTGLLCEDDCLAAAVQTAFDLTPAGIITELDLQRPIYARTAVGGHLGRTCPGKSSTHRPADGFADLRCPASPKNRSPLRGK